jgi:hypothetical protein
MRLRPCLVAAVLLATALRAAGVAAEQAAPAAAIADLAWLEGTWVSEADSTRVEERWTSPAGGAMLSTSRTLRGGRMVAFEFLRIVARPGGVVYIAQPGGRPPTEFALTASGPGRAVFENPAHDFPKRLTYHRSGSTLRVEVEGDEKGKPLRDVYEFTLAAGR